MRNKSVNHCKNAVNALGQIGLIVGWGFKDSNFFLNFETGERIEVGKDLTGVTIISDEEGRKLYKERNYPQTIFDDTFYKKDCGIEIADRQKSYGMLHDTHLKLFFEESTNGFWTDDFSRAMANILSLVELTKDPDYHYIDEGNRGEGMKLMQKYMLGDGSSYEKWCNRMGMQGEIEVTDDEIIDGLVEALEIAKTDTRMRDTMTTGPMVQGVVEFAHFMEIAKNKKS